MEYIYAALLLHKVGQAVNETNMHNVIKATGAHVDESKIKVLLASLHGVDIAHELAHAQIAVAAPAAGASAGEAKKEEKKEEKQEESAAGLASLFG